MVLVLNVYYKHILLIDILIIFTEIALDTVNTTEIQ